MFVCAELLRVFVVVSHLRRLRPSLGTAVAGYLCNTSQFFQLVITVLHPPLSSGEMEERTEQ